MADCVSLSHSTTAPIASKIARIGTIVRPSINAGSTSNVSFSPSRVTTIGLSKAKTADGKSITKAKTKHNIFFIVSLLEFYNHIILQIFTLFKNFYLLFFKTIDAKTYNNLSMKKVLNFIL